MTPVPIDMVLFCPQCGTQHIDAPDAEPHLDVARTDEDASERCGHIWRPADVPTNGVLAIKTQGQNDSPISTADFIASCASPSTLDQWVAAEAEALQRGMAFIVHGRHISADFVEIVSAGDGTGPIAEMRREKREAQELLAQIERARNAPVVTDQGILNRFRQLRKWHMDCVNNARKRQLNAQRKHFLQTASACNSEAMMHLGFVQLLNELFPVGDNDHLGGR